MHPLVKVWNLGRINYLLSLNLQKHLVELHHNNKLDEVSNTLLLVEHPPVYTIGIRRKDYTEFDEQKLKDTGAEFYQTNRGGLITFHGPGQLVVYPIINLKHFKAGMRWYVCHIEKAVINLCRNLGLAAETSPHTGVWIGENKICAIGVHGSRFITSHGLALNCNTDLSWYDHIVPCGIQDRGVTSLSNELGKRVCIEDVIPTFLKCFSEEFNCTLTEFPSLEKDYILTNLKER